MDAMLSLFVLFGDIVDIIDVNAECKFTTALMQSRILSSVEINSPSMLIESNFISNVCRELLIYYIGILQGYNHWGSKGSQPLQHFCWPSIVDRTFYIFTCGGRLQTLIWNVFHVFIKKKIISRFQFQLYFRLNDLKFEIPVFGKAHRAPSPDPFPTMSRCLPSFRASPSNLGRFASSIRASPDSDPNFQRVVAPLV